MFDIQTIAKHIAGADNHFADMLSRNNVIQLEKGQWQWCWNRCCLPAGNTDSNTISSLHYITSFPGLDLTLIQNMLHRYFDNGISSATRVTYAAGQQRYLDFCSAIHRPPLPTNEHTLLLFITHLAIVGLSHTATKCIPFCSSQHACCNWLPVNLQFAAHSSFATSFKRHKEDPGYFSTSSH